METIFEINNSSIYRIWRQVYFAIRDENWNIKYERNLSEELKRLDKLHNPLQEILDDMINWPL
jgi:hypothetical protein